MADRLKTDLARVFGTRAVFLDRHSIEAGENWRDALTQSVQESKVVLVLVGPKWLTVQNKHGRRPDIREKTRHPKSLSSANFRKETTALRF